MTTLTARRRPHDRSVSGWCAILPDPPAPRILDGDITADWVVVGGGFAGLAAARRLAQTCGGDRIVLLEGQRIGWGAAGRNSGFMIDLPHALNSDSYAGSREADLKRIAMNRAGIAYMREAVEEFGLERFFNPCGKLHGAADGGGLKALGAFQRCLTALDEPYVPLTQADLKDITGTGYYAGGAHTPGAAIVQPAGLVRGLAGALADKVDIYENAPVLEIKSDGDRLIHTPNGRIRAKTAIMTVNGQIESFGLYKRRLLHIFLYASMTRELSAAERRTLGGRDEWALVPADPMGSTVRRLREGRIVVRNSASYNPGMETSAAQIARAGRANDKSFRARFPMLPDVEMEYRWSGHLCLSSNAAPVFGEIATGIYAACCQNGLGTVQGTLAGKLIADLATGSNEPLAQDMLAHDPPKRLYPEPFLTLGVNAALWWRKHRAGADF